ncbi:VOC family protein [Proteus hauseri]|uniref:VOC family protein n=1 Tax=Proteus hauseri TaxID=183417 RepID=UPI001009562F|nr:VOC family protein [Proteus hauseri]QAV24595.1 phenazine biosynthesis protein [Proteus hauseri]
MFKPNSIIIYAKDVDKSTDFYAKILKSAPLERYREFSVFALSSDFILGIQSKTGIDPKPQAQFGGFEICMSDITYDKVNKIYQQWCGLKVEIEMPPKQLDFGYTFVALDPDGHRLRVCATDTTNVD